MKTFHYPSGNVALHTLTVGELIDLLAKYPRDMPVLAEWEGQRAPLGNYCEVSMFTAGAPGEGCECLVLDAEN